MLFEHAKTILEMAFHILAPKHIKQGCIEAYKTEPERPVVNRLSHADRMAAISP